MLRQVDLWNVHSSTSPDSEFITDNENELLKLIRNYGKFNFNSSINFSDIFKVEDEDQQIDHEIYHKCVSDTDCAISNSNEQIVVDFSSNRRFLRDSIINITVQETKDLIEGQQRKPADTSVDSSKSISPTDTSVKSTKSTKKKRSFRPKITIHNCNARIINLRNIANLTINCAKDSSIPKEKPPSSMDEETVTSTTKEDEDMKGNCEFYERLLNEIKKSLVKKTRAYPLVLSGDEEETPVDTPTNEDVLATPDSTSEEIGIEKPTDRKLVLRNFENLKIILENIDGTDLHPVQIEQWLAEIVSETEVEPNIGEIFEHSEITS